MDANPGAEEKLRLRLFFFGKFCTTAGHSGSHSGGLLARQRNHTGSDPADPQVCKKANSREPFESPAAWKMESV
jgi:hypothetical protein